MNSEIDAAATGSIRAGQRLEKRLERLVSLETAGVMKVDDEPIDGEIEKTKNGIRVAYGFMLGKDEIEERIQVAIRSGQTQAYGR